MQRNVKSFIHGPFSIQVTILTKPHQCSSKEPPGCIQGALKTHPRHVRSKAHPRNRQAASKVHSKHIRGMQGAPEAKPRHKNRCGATSKALYPPRHKKNLQRNVSHLYAGRQQPSPIQGTTKLRPSCLKVAPRVILSASSHSFSPRSWLFTPRIDIHVLGLGRPQLVGDPRFAEVEPSTMLGRSQSVAGVSPPHLPCMTELWKNWQEPWQTWRRKQT